MGCFALGPNMAGALNKRTDCKPIDCPDIALKPIRSDKSHFLLIYHVIQLVSSMHDLLVGQIPDQDLIAATGQ